MISLGGIITLDPNPYIALSGRHERTAPPKTQGDAIGLGYIGLSVRNGVMKNVCDQAKFPANTSPIAMPRALSLKYPSPMATPWVTYPPIVGCALKGQHTACIYLGATLFSNLYIALSGRHDRTAHPKNQGDAIGLGYARLSALPPTVRVYQGGHLIL
jgi:hypothetical protein